MEVRHRLLNFGDKIIYQDSDWFNFSLDSVILTNFVTIKKNDKIIVDLATGNAPIPMLLTYRTKAKIYGIEIQKEIFELGNKSIIENKFDEQIELINDDVKNLKRHFKDESIDIVTCNPPYFKVEIESLVNENEIKRNARHETLLSLEDVIKEAKRLLKNGGTFALVHRVERLIEVIELMRKYNIEPKKLQLVYSKNHCQAKTILIEGVKNGNEGLKVLEPMIVHNEKGEYNKEIKKMFEE